MLLINNPDFVAKQTYSLLFIYLLCTFRCIMDGEDGLSKNAVKVEWSATANATVQQGATASLAVQPGTSESVVMEPGTSKSGVMEVEAANESGNESSGRATPDSSCSICLGAVVNKSFTDSCMHQFCFTCLKQWSKVCGLLHQI